jgi:hypothetical protein
MKVKSSLLVLVITTILLSGVNGMATNQTDPKIEGTWDVTVNLSDPNLPPSFSALETYNRDGGFVTSNNMPFLTRVGQGAWEKNGRQYFVKIKFFKFDPSGLPAGTISIIHTITLDSKDQYSGTGTAVFCELDGVTCQSVGFTTVGNRLNAGS